MYENNDPNTENNESSTYRYTPERGTQSDYTAGAHNADSQYSAGPQSGYIPGSYSYSPRAAEEKEETLRRKDHRHRPRVRAAGRMPRRRRNASAAQ